MTNKDTDLNSPTLPSTLPHRSALHSMLSYIQRAKENLGALSSSSSREAEAVWFMKIAWNLALQCGEHYHEMSQLFTACHQVKRLHTLIYTVTLTEHLYFWWCCIFTVLSLQLLGCAPLDSSVLQRQKTCQLMAAGACVQVAQSTNRQEEKVRNTNTHKHKIPVVAC